MQSSASLLGGRALRRRLRLGRVPGLATQEPFQRVSVDFGVAQRGLIDEPRRFIAVQNGVIQREHVEWIGVLVTRRSRVLKLRFGHFASRGRARGQRRPPPPNSSRRGGAGAKPHLRGNLPPKIGSAASARRQSVRLSHHDCAQKRVVNARPATAGTEPERARLRHRARDRRAFARADAASAACTARTARATTHRYTVAACAPRVSGQLASLGAHRRARGHAGSQA